MSYKFEWLLEQTMEQLLSMEEQGLLSHEAVEIVEHHKILQELKEKRGIDLFWYPQGDCKNDSV